VITEDSGAFVMSDWGGHVSNQSTGLARNKLSPTQLLSDSVRMLRKIEKGWFRKQWVESLRKSGLSWFSFLHHGTQGLEEIIELTNVKSVPGIGLHQS
jgi:hypothetical protein